MHFVLVHFILLRNWERVVSLFVYAIGKLLGIDIVMPQDDEHHLAIVNDLGDRDSDMSKVNRDEVEERLPILQVPAIDVFSKGIGTRNERLL